MPLNQMNACFNDAFEVYFPRQGFLERMAYRTAGFLVMQAFQLRNRLFRGRLLVNERIIEYPLVFQWMKPGGKVLDIGCVSSRLPIQLASLGYEVDGLDARPYGFTHPGFRFHRTDLFQWAPEDKYDIILLVSVIEHFGLGGYGDSVLPEADNQAVDTIAGWLKDDGQLLVSLPFGKPEVTEKHRIYDYERLRRVFGRFTWERERYFMRKDAAWRPASREEVEAIPSPGLPANGVAVLDLRPARNRPG